MNIEYVKVPKHKLEQLEEGRIALYKLLGEVLDNPTHYQQHRSLAFGELLGITGTMWELGNRKWEVCDESVDESVDIPDGWAL